MKTIITSNDKSYFNFGELKKFTGLFKYLSLRDVSVRYKQTWIGFGWSIIRPLINIIIFGLLSYLVDKSQSFYDKFLMVSAGVIFWQLISTTITEVSNSLSANAAIFTKVYFPKLILPFSCILVCLIDFLVAFIIFMVLFIVAKGLPSWHFVFLPLVIIYGLVFSFSFGLLFATASVKYRDVKFILPFVIQILFYASPVFLSSSFILSLNMPDFLKVVYQMNPIVFILNAFKFCLYGSYDSFQLNYVLIGFGISITLFFTSIKYFLNFEKSFADYI